MPRAATARGPTERAELLIKPLYQSLTAEQKRVVLLPWSDRRRTMVGNNWKVVEPTIGQTFNREQKELIKEIFKGVTSEQGWEKFQKQMKDDYGGFENYHVAIFADEEGKKLEWVLTGRHLTIRADGGLEANAAFGGPIFYGHAVEFNEKPDHPGNVWWHQARLANKVYAALDGKQQAKALITDGSPPDTVDSIRIKGPNGKFAGIAVGELSRDQKALVEEVMRALLEPYRPSDVEEVMQCITKNGGLDKVHLQFFKDQDLGNDGIWDRWRLEGPSFVWYFRGSPHVHTWINIVHKPMT
ncbi:MAG: DUF3500 domain-containing protein [Abditibacteriales bacterium]|nr:DUF3500 domain-containing protein [Abditibacteriales bacterium]MDW8368168.1 DUF3500 domain-containing protein [Abditibacteriales bacterium]